MKKQIVCLIGLKGSGKSTIGRLLQSSFGWTFVRVEDIWADLSSKWTGTREEYIQEGFQMQTKLILDLLSQSQKIVFESTGTTQFFPKMISELSKAGRVSLVKVECDSDVCSERVRTRDSANHVNVSDSQLQEINEAASKVEFKWDCLVQNDGSVSPEKVAEQIDCSIQNQQ